MSEDMKVNQLLEDAKRLVQNQNGILPSDEKKTLADYYIRIAQVLAIKDLAEAIRNERAKDA